MTGSSTTGTVTRSNNAGLSIVHESAEGVNGCAHGLAALKIRKHETSQTIEW
jgi:hypothetical protein